VPHVKHALLVICSAGCRTRSGLYCYSLQIDLQRSVEAGAAPANGTHCRPIKSITSSMSFLSIRSSRVNHAMLFYGLSICSDKIVRPATIMTANVRRRRIIILMRH